MEGVIGVLQVVVSRRSVWCKFAAWVRSRLFDRSVRYVEQYLGGIYQSIGRVYECIVFVYENVGDLPLWCEEFATALTSALGFPEAPFAGALNNHPDRYKSFHGWFLVMGHLLETIRVFGGEKGQAELKNYFQGSRVWVDLSAYSGGREEFGSLEEAFYCFLRRNSLRNAGAATLIDAFGIEWKSYASRIILGCKEIPWWTRDEVELFLGYAQIVFSAVPGVTDLEAEIKKQLLRPGLYKG